jgi:hypothetical protein
LRKLLPDSNFLWEEVEQKHEPPDFYLTVDTEKYAVEVTQLILQADVGAIKPQPYGTVRDILRKFVIDDIEEVAKKNYFLHGTYSVMFSKPITNFSHLKDFIQYALLSYISSTQDVSKAPTKVVFEQDRQKCSIEKTYAEDDKVVMGGPIILRQEDEVLTECQQLLDNRLSEKEKRLRKVN